VLDVACLLAAALLLRVDGITQPSLSTRELHNALLAREYYFGGGTGLPAWKQRVLAQLRRSVKPVEPPVLDHLAAWEYRLTGGEHMWAPRLVSALLWVIGGVFLYLIALRVTSSAGAVVALALYLFWPYAVVISRLYLPDPMMVALILAGALALIRYSESPTRGRFAAAAAVAAAATAAKPGIALVFLVVLFAALALSQHTFRQTLLRGRLLLFALAAATPTVAYYIYGTYVRHFLEAEGDASERLQPHLVLTGSFWRGWWTQLATVLPFPQHQRGLALIPILAALAGIGLVRTAKARAILAGLALGYVAYALAVAGYTADNAYYALPLFPVLALAVGATAGFAIERLNPASRGGFAALLAIVVAIALVSTYKSRPSAADHKTVAAYRHIGVLTGHSTRAVIVDERLRTPAMYWGWIVAQYWYEPTPAQDLPPSGNPFPRRIDSEQASYLVVTDMSELRSERRLRTFVRGLPVVARTGRFAVFDLRGGRALTASQQSVQG
jgi:4-amino-4-deoxy-L-arabinose transferase-like glycosyltransferase